MLLLIAKIVAALSAYGKPSHIGFAMAMGLVLALLPGGTLVWFLLFIPMMLIRINQAALLGTLGVFRLVVPFIDPLTEQAGFFLLNQPFTADLMPRVLSVPLMPWFRLNDSLVFGALAAGLLGLPLYIFFFSFVVALYRRFLAEPVKKFFGALGKKLPWLKKLSSAVGTLRRAGVK